MPVCKLEILWSTFYVKHKSDIHVTVWQKPLQYCKVIGLQLIKIIGKKIKNKQTNKKLSISLTFKQSPELC